MNTERKEFSVRLFLFVWILAISFSTARAGSYNIGDRNQGDNNIGNENQGNGNIGNNNTGNFNQGINQQNLPELQAQAKAGDPAAQLTLAGKYLFGDGVPIDTETALKWSQRAAEYADKNPSWHLSGVAFAALGSQKH